MWQVRKVESAAPYSHPLFFYTPQLSVWRTLHKRRNERLCSLPTSFLSALQDQRQRQLFMHTPAAILQAMPQIPLRSLSFHAERAEFGIIQALCTDADRVGASQEAQNRRALLSSVSLCFLTCFLLSQGDEALSLWKSDVMYKGKGHLFSSTATKVPYLVMLAHPP